MVLEEHMGLDILLWQVLENIIYLASCIKEEKKKCFFDLRVCEKPTGKKTYR